MEGNYRSEPTDSQLLVLTGLRKMVSTGDKEQGKRRPGIYATLPYMRVLRSCMCSTPRDRVTAWDLAEMLYGAPLNHDSINDKQGKRVPLTNQLKSDLQDVFGIPWGPVRHGKKCYYYPAGNEVERREILLGWSYRNADGNLRSPLRPSVEAMLEDGNGGKTVEAELRGRPSIVKALRKLLPQPIMENWISLTSYPVRSYGECMDCMDRAYPAFALVPRGQELHGEVMAVLARDRALARGLEQLAVGSLPELIEPAEATRPIEPISVPESLGDPNRPIAELGLGFSVRTTNDLYRMDCCTVGEFFHLDMEKFKGCRGVGPITHAEVMKAKEKLEGSAR